MDIDAQRREMLTKYDKVVNLFLNTYATHEVIAELYSDVTCFMP